MSFDSAAFFEEELPPRPIEMPIAIAAATRRIAPAMVATFAPLFFVDAFEESLESFVVPSLEFFVESPGEFFVELSESFEDWSELCEELWLSFDEFFESFDCEFEFEFPEEFPEFPEELPESDFELLSFA